MMKYKTTLYLEKETVQRAKELGLNVSKTCENALIEAIRKLEGNSKENSSEKWRRGRDSNPRRSALQADA